MHQRSEIFLSAILPDAKKNNTTTTKERLKKSFKTLLNARCKRQDRKTGGTSQCAYKNHIQYLEHSDLDLTLNLMAEIRTSRLPLETSYCFEISF